MLGQATRFGAVTLGGATTIDSSNMAVDFVNTVDATTAGGQGLTVNAGTGIVTFGGAVGGATPPASLMATGPATLDGNVTTIGMQTCNSAVTLAAPLGATDTLTTTNSAIDFAGTVDAAIAGGQGVAVSAGTATVTFGGAVGGSAALASLIVSSPTRLDGNVTTSGTQTYDGVVTLGATDTLMTTNGAVDFVSIVDAAIAGGQGLTISARTGIVTVLSSKRHHKIAVNPHAKPYHIGHGNLYHPQRAHHQARRDQRHHRRPRRSHPPSPRQSSAPGRDFSAVRSRRQPDTD